MNARQKMKKYKKQAEELSERIERFELMLNKNKIFARSVTKTPIEFCCKRVYRTDNQYEKEYAQKMVSDSICDKVREYIYFEHRDSIFDGNCEEVVGRIRILID